MMLFNMEGHGEISMVCCYYRIKNKNKSCYIILLASITMQMGPCFYERQPSYLCPGSYLVLQSQEMISYSYPFFQLQCLLLLLSDSFPPECKCALQELS